eukprot:479322-Rhodomonas_salina.1
MRALEAAAHQDELEPAGGVETPKLAEEPPQLHDDWRRVLVKSGVNQRLDTVILSSLWITRAVFSRGCPYRPVVCEQRCGVLISWMLSCRSHAQTKRRIGAGPQGMEEEVDEVNENGHENGTNGWGYTNGNGTNSEPQVAV